MASLSAFSPSAILDAIVRAIAFFSVTALVKLSISEPRPSLLAVQVPILSFKVPTSAVLVPAASSLPASISACNARIFS